MTTAVDTSTAKAGSQSPLRRATSPSVTAEAGPRSKSHPPRQGSPPPLNHRASSKLDLEPNPFEQSFSASSTTDSRGHAAVADDAPGAPRPSPTGATAGALNTPKPILPPLAALASPQPQGGPSGAGGFPWGAGANGAPGGDNATSLRSGPLSPAMLAGPSQQPSTTHAFTTPGGSFDPSTFRTGFTPGGADLPIGRTGLTPLVNGGYPPPSPNTAAFLAMVNSGGAPGLTPNTLNAITGVVNGLGNGPPPVSGAPPSVTAAPSATWPPTTSAANPSAPPDAYSQGALRPLSEAERHVISGASAAGQGVNPFQPPGDAAAAAANAANGLFLLSQAHQELAKREGTQEPSPSASSSAPASSAKGKAGGGGGGSKRKKADAPEPKKKARTTAGKGGKKAAANKKDEEPESSNDGGGDDDDATSPTSATSPDSNKKGKKAAPAAANADETEEEKRRNFLERNRQAALKCRQRKKAWLQQLQQKVEFLTTDNEALQQTVLALREEVGVLRGVLAQHSGCAVGAPGAPPPGYAPPMPPQGMPGAPPPPQGMPGQPPQAIPGRPFY